jgi:hypothetical protein
MHEKHKHRHHHGRATIDGERPYCRWIVPH